MHANLRFLLAIHAQATTLDNLSFASSVDENLSKNMSFLLNEANDRFEELRLRTSSSESLTNHSQLLTNTTHESSVDWISKGENDPFSDNAESEGHDTESKGSPSASGEGGIEQWTTLIGLALMVFYLVFDGFTSSYQDRLFRESNGSTYLMLLYATGFGVLASASALVSVGVCKAWISRGPGTDGYKRVYVHTEKGGEERKSMSVFIISS